MSVNIDSFSNADGGNSLFKALTHPAILEPLLTLKTTLEHAKNLAIYDPKNILTPLGEIIAFNGIKTDYIFVQAIERLGGKTLGRINCPITEIKKDKVDTLFIAEFDAHLSFAHIKHLLNEGVEIITLDCLKLPEQYISNPKNYLDPLNFATNFSLFRAEGNLHTRIATGNYWAHYGAKNPYLWLQLFAEDGSKIHEWTEDLPNAYGLVMLDSRQIKERFHLDDFCGQLFIHVIKPKGHDIVKYALDVYEIDVAGREKIISCSHDANCWPAKLYAGLPAPTDEEDIVFWIQNNQPFDIPAGEVSFNVMGHPAVKKTIDYSIAPFATLKISMSELFPDVKWPAQFEIYAGKYFVRPRYEIIPKATGIHFISHVNVERTDLDIDPKLAQIEKVAGKGFILPAPILPIDQFTSTALPTPMSTAQNHLPIKASFYDHEGTLINEHALGNLPRNHQTTVDMSKAFQKDTLQMPASNYGHVELTYDFDAGNEADGWLHSLFRYRQKGTGRLSDTSFGAHFYNIPMTYKKQPFSYTGNPPGLSTRLFLRLNNPENDTHCQLIYPSSKKWHPYSNTTLYLYSGDGEIIAEEKVKIACGGSHYFRFYMLFNEKSRAQAGKKAYILIRDTSCRLFGYHGLIEDGKAFSLDHMFGY